MTLTDDFGFVKNYGDNNEDQNRCTLPMEFAVYTKRVNIVISQVRENAAMSFINYRANVLARLSKSDRKLFDKEEKKLIKILTALFLIDTSISNIRHS